MEYERWAPIGVVNFRRKVCSRTTPADGETVTFLDIQSLFRAMVIEVLGSPESGEPCLVEAFRKTHFVEEDLQSPRQNISYRLTGSMLVQYKSGR